MQGSPEIPAPPLLRYTDVSIYDVYERSWKGGHGVVREVMDEESCVRIDMQAKNGGDGDVLRLSKKERRTLPVFRSRKTHNEEKE